VQTLIGSRLAHYEITAKLGAGGMGEVYQATDTKLGREVAVKVLPAALANDPERVARFQREARTLASIQHPNIASLYGFEEADGHRFLVMELAEGEDLAARVQGGALSPSEALHIARQVAVGLEAAHAKGIVHRDLKPANVKIGPGGQVKILDFGLARAYAEEHEPQDFENSPTITAAMTQRGVILGTAAYMSPEQARGKDVDKRTDLWALGCVLYEMLTGDRFFEGETLSDSIGAILHKEPDLTRLPAATPPIVRHLLQRCLAKDPDKRIRDAGDARLDLEQALADLAGSAPGTDASTTLTAGALAGRGVPAWWIAVGVLVGTAMGTGIATLRSPAPPAPVVRKLDLGIELSAPAQDQITAALAPNGHNVAFTHEGKLWVQALDQFDPRPFDDTEGAMDPFWSPDGTEIGYFAQGTIWKVTLRGGRPVQLCTLEGGLAGGHGAWWDESDRIVFAPGNGSILAVSGRGGQPHEIIPREAEDGDLHEPSVLPGGRGILFAAHRKDGGAYQLCLFVEGKRRVLYKSDQRQEFLGDPRYDASGCIVLDRRQGTATEGVWAVPFDLESLQVTGEPFLVAAGARQPRPARDGSMSTIYGLDSALGSQQLAWYNHNGRKLDVIGGGRSSVEGTVFSPDGSKLAVAQWDPENRQMDLWVVDLVRGSEIRLTNDTNIDVVPTFLPSGEELTFASVRLGMPTFELRSYRLRIDGTGEPGIALEGGVPTAVTRDGAFFLATMAADPGDSSEMNPQTTPFVVASVPTGGSAPPHRMTRAAPQTFSAGLSPDDRWALFQTGVAGASDVFVTSFPDGGRRWQVSVDGGRDAFWDPQGDRIYYLQGQTLYEVSFGMAADEPRLGTPVQLFDIPSHMSSGPSSPPSVDIDPNGQRFLVVDHLERGEEQKPRVKIVQNWAEEFR
jgi:hypothetical protein